MLFVLQTDDPYNPGEPAYYVRPDWLVATPDHARKFSLPADAEIARESLPDPDAWRVVRLAEVVGGFVVVETEARS
jgi:hypothetical protein